MAEFTGGGLALVTVALIAVSSAHIARPRAPVLAAPLHYASTSIETSEEVAKLSLKQEDQPPDGGGKADGAQSSNPVSDKPATLNPVVPVHAAPPLLPPAAVPSAPQAISWPIGRGIKDAARIQQSGPQAGSARPDARLGSLDLSPDPARVDPRPHNTPARARAAPTFVGGWSDDISRCRAEAKTPIVISWHAAKTENGECDFGRVARVAANRWRVAAICTSEGEFWRANIALKLVEPNLTWSSERGTQTYVRCKH